MKLRKTIFFYGISLLSILMSALSCAETLDSVVAVVNDDVVTKRELDDHLHQYQQQLRASQSSMPEPKVLQKQVLNQLIDQSLQLQIAQEGGIEVDMAEVDEAIARIAANNRLSLTDFRLALEKDGLTFERYREMLQTEMKIARVQQQIVGHQIAVSSEQIEDYLKNSQAVEKASHAYHVQHILIALPDEPTPDMLTKGKQKAHILHQQIQQGVAFDAAVTAEASMGEYPAEFNDLGARHLAELPEVFSQKIIQMKPGDVSAPIRTDNGYQLLKLIAVHKPNKHHEVLKTHVRHILIKADASTTEDAAKRRVDNLYEQLKSGKSFESLAKLYSADISNSEKGGDLGWVTAEELTPAFAEVMQQLSLNEISHPVKSNFGWHLIEVLGRETVDDSEAYERQQIHQFLHQRKFAEAVEGWQRHLRNTSYIQIMDEALV